MGKLSGGRIEVEAFRLQNIAANAQFPSCGQQVATPLAMEAGIVGYGLEDVGGIGGKRGELIDHHIRRGRFDRNPHRFRVEGIGIGRLRTEFAKTIAAPSSARHADHLVAESAQRTHQR